MMIITGGDDDDEHTGVMFYADIISFPHFEPSIQLNI